MNCNHECSTCASKCIVNCPICNKNAREVKLNAVLNLVNDSTNIRKDEKVYICQNKKCDLVYFQENNPNYYLKKDISVPIWFKEKYDKYMVCYCRGIYLDDIVKIIKEHLNENKLTKEDIIKYFDEKEISCETKNPLGESCEKLFDNAIEYAYHILKEDK